MNISLLKHPPTLLLFLSAAFLVACGGGSETNVSVYVGTQPPDEEQPPPTSQVDVNLRVILAAEKISGDPSRHRVLPHIDEALPRLGMKLFFSKSLSGDADTACVSCHHPLLGGGDALSLPIGTGAEDPNHLGPGRRHAAVAAHFDGGPTVARNAPTTFNAAMWDKFMLHDGNLESLDGLKGLNGAGAAGIRSAESEDGQANPAAGANLPTAQSRLPVAGREEMQGFTFAIEEDNNGVRRALARRLAAQELPNTWLPLFQEAFDSHGDADELITFENIAFALGEYQRSQVFVNNPWKAYVEGDNKAISEAAKRGALLFYRPAQEGGAGCATCHGGDFFSDEDFHILAVPQIGRGLRDGENGDEDFGRFRETGQERDKYAFRTPTLLNVEVTAPYGHSGAYPDLEGIVRHHLNPARALDAYDFNLSLMQEGIQKTHAEANSRATLAQLQANRAGGTARLQDIELNEAQISDLLAFLRALTDPCVKEPACLQAWMPDPASTGPDHLQLNFIP